MTLETIAARIDALAERLDAVLAMAVRPGDPEWTRMPSAISRCPVSRWSRSTILRHIDAGRVRTRKSGGSRFYSAADIRAILSSTTDNHENTDPNQDTPPA